jgi:hypothetical protein
VPAVDVALDESTRALSSQDTELDSLHTRASFILAGAGIASGAVLSGPTGVLHGFAIAAIGGFTAASLLATVVLLPLFNSWAFTNNARSILEKADTGISEEDLKRWLATWNQKHVERNKAQLDRLYRVFYAAAISLIVATGCTLLNLLVK